MKKLWQAIGLENNHEESALHPLQINLQYDEDTPHSIIELSNKISHSEKHKRGHTQQQKQIKGESKPLEDQLSIEIESCESEPLDSSQSKNGIKQQPPKINKLNANRDKLRRVREEVSALGKYNILIKDWMKQQAQIRSKQIQSITSQYAIIIQTFQTQLQQSKKCVKCESTKSIIDTLTKQCWEYEAKYKEKQSELGKMSKKVSKEEDPMKKIQVSLLHQRGQALKKLKKEVDQLRQENDSLQQLLFVKENDLANLQNRYKVNLQSLKAEMQEIQSACHRNISKAIQEKATREAECIYLRNRCQQIEEQLQQQKLQRSVKKKIHTQYQQAFSDLPTSNKEIEVPYINIRPKRATQKFQRTIQTPKKNGTSILELDLKQSAQLYSQGQVKNFSRINTDRHFVAIDNKDNIRSPHSKNKTFDLSPLALKKNKYCVGSKSIKMLDVSSSIDNPFLRLQELQKNVRKQINRSKKSHK